MAGYHYFVEVVGSADIYAPNQRVGIEKGKNQGGGNMRIRLVAIILLVSACSWTPKIIGPYPDGLIIIRGDQELLDHVCSHISDDGHYIKHAAGCNDGENNTIYLLNNCEGARALTHELGHRQGISDPAKAGFNWN